MKLVTALLIGATAAIKVKNDIRAIPSTNWPSPEDFMRMVDNNEVNGDKNGRVTEEEIRGAITDYKEDVLAGIEDALIKGFNHCVAVQLK